MQIENVDLEVEIRKGYELIMDMNNLKLRIYSSIVLFPIVFFPIYLGGWFFTLALVFFVTILFYELITISGQKKKNVLSILYFFSLILITLLWDFIWPALILLLISLSISSLWNLFIMKKNTLWILYFLNYTLIFFVFFYSLVNNQSQDGSKYIILFIISIAILSDLGGYIGGKLIGKKKAFPKISPNKTVEGTISAILFPTIINFSILNSINYQIDKTILIILLVLLSIGAILGDLFASLIKRNFNIKNASNLLPGHGGFLDRFDSVIGVTITYILIVYFYELYAMMQL